MPLPKSRIVVIDRTLYVRIPAKVVRHPAFRPDGAFEVDITSDGSLVMTPATYESMACFRCGLQRHEHTPVDNRRPLCSDGKRMRYTE